MSGAILLFSKCVTKLEVPLIELVQKTNMLTAVGI